MQEFVQLVLLRSSSGKHIIKCYLQLGVFCPVLLYCWVFQFTELVVQR